MLRDALALTLVIVVFLLTYMWLRSTGLPDITRPYLPPPTTDLVHLTPHGGFTIGVPLLIQKGHKIIPGPRRGMRWQPVRLLDLERHQKRRDAEGEHLLDDGRIGVEVEADGPTHGHHLMDL